MKKLSVLLLVVLSFIFLPIRVYADTISVNYEFEDIAIVGKKFEYTIKGYAGIDENGSSNIDGTITYDEDVFELLEVIDNPIPESLDVVGVPGKIDKKLSKGQIEFDYIFEEYDQLERVDLTFVFKVKSKPSNSKSIISYMSKINYGTENEPHDVEIEVFDTDTDSNSNEYQNNMLLYCSLGISAVLLITLIVVLTKYLKLKKQ